jgi:hypothetical protein
MFKPGDKAILLSNPGFSTKDRTGWEVEVDELIDEHGEPYLAVRDKLGVSWPLDESKLGKVCSSNSSKAGA